ncbi:MAG: 2'-5' RNA ligase, partial [Firmicutes bacterium]|nr:2'-5' RNA ligase [Bacillota bacterium]
MEDRHLYVVAQFDAETDKILNQIYLSLVNEGFVGTQTKGIPYHITLGTFEVEDEVDVIRRAHEAAGSQRAFTLRMAYLGLFGLNVLFAAPAVKCALLDLRNAVVPGGGTADEFPWVAHTTLLMDEPETIHRAIPVAVKHF